MMNFNGGRAPRGWSAYRQAEIDIGAWESLMHCWCPVCCHETNESWIKNRVHSVYIISPIMYMEAHIRRLELNALIFFFFFFPADFYKRISCLNAAQIHSSYGRWAWPSTVVRGRTYADSVKGSLLITLPLGTWGNSDRQSETTTKGKRRNNSK